MNPFDHEDEDDDNVITGDFEQNDDLQDGLPGDNEPAPSAPLDAKAIAEIVQATFAANQPQQQTQQRQMTPEEAAAHFQVFNPDDSFVNGLNALADENATPEDRRKIVNTLRDGLVNQSFRATELFVQQKMAEMDQRYAPAVKFLQEREAQQLMTDFEKTYPALKGQSELVNSITSSLKQQGFKPASKEAAFEKVAQVAEQILKRVDPNFTVQKKAGGGRSPAMAGTNMGGQTGGFQAAPRANAPGKRGGLAPFFMNK